MSKQEKLEELVRKLHESQETNRNHKIGKVLTIIDAAFTDPEQRKATKDLVKEVFYSFYIANQESEIHRLVRLYAESENVKIFPEENYIPLYGGDEINPFNK